MTIVQSLAAPCYPVSSLAIWERFTSQPTSFVRLHKNKNKKNSVLMSLKKARNHTRKRSLILLLQSLSSTRGLTTTSKQSVLNAVVHQMKFQGAISVFCSRVILIEKFFQVSATEGPRKQKRRPIPLHHGDVLKSLTAVIWAASPALR